MDYFDPTAGFVWCGANLDSNFFVFASDCFGLESDGGNVRSSYGDDASEEVTRVTRTIMIVKPPGHQNGSPPVSPAGSTPPVSPFSGELSLFSWPNDNEVAGLFSKWLKCPLLFCPEKVEFRDVD